MEPQHQAQLLSCRCLCFYVTSVFVFVSLSLTVHVFTSFNMSLFLHPSLLSKAGLSTLQRGGGETDGFLPSHPFATIATVCRRFRETFFLSSHFFLIFEKHSAAEVVHQAFTAQFSYIPRVGLTRCNAFPFGQLFKGEVLKKCGKQRRTTNSEKCHFDLNQTH